MSKMSFLGQTVGGKNLRMAFKRSGVRFSYAPPLKRLKINQLEPLSKALLEALFVEFV